MPSCCGRPPFERKVRTRLRARPLLGGPVLWAPGWCSPVSHALPQCTLRGQRVCPLDQAWVTTRLWYWTGFSTGKRCQECTLPPRPYPMAGQPGTERPCGPHDQFSYSQGKGISRDWRFCGHCWSKGERLWSLRGQEGAKKLLLLELWSLVSF